MQLYRYAALCLFFCQVGTSFAQASTDAVPVNVAQRKEVVAALGTQLKANYIFPEIADRVAARMSTRVKSGAYDEIRTADSFAKVLTKDIRDAGKDLHFVVDYDPTFKMDSDDNQPPTKAQLDEMEADAAQSGFGIAKVERLAGNVGYLDIRGFFPADFVAGAYGSAIKLLSGTNALILDLRQNQGGDPSAVAALLSYFFSEGDDRHLNDLYWRSAKRTQEFWTGPVPGQRYIKPVYVLVSPTTFSGGEECAYDFQTQKRAIVVGQKTGGGANPGAMFPLGHGFIVFIPTGRAINPVTKTNWEHIGVMPDITVPAGDAMKTAYEIVLKSLIPKTTDPDQLKEQKEALVRLENGQEEQPDYSPPQQ